MDTAEFNNIMQYRFVGVAAPVPIIKRVIRDLSGEPTHIGFAKSGTATNIPGWIVEKLFYSDGNYSHSLYSPKNSIMDNYASLTYS